MKKFFFFLLAIVISFFALTHPVIAQNKAGINIGTKYSDADKAISTVGSGGWLVVIAGGTGDCANLQGIIDKANSAGVNVIIRGHLNNQLSPNDAKAWAATLGQLNTGSKVYFMPWNEPNQEGSDDYGDPAAVVSYCNALRQALNDSGAVGKVFLLSPMLNQSYIGGGGDFDTYVGRLKKADNNFFSRFDGIAMNLYDFGEERCGSALCDTNAHYNPAKYRDILSIMGASGKPAFGVESGTGGDNFYWRKSPVSDSPLYRFVQKFLPLAPEMFAIPSYDLGGEVSHTWSLFDPPDTANLLSSGPKGGTSPAGFNKTAFDSWLASLTQSGELIPCGSCGYAHKDNPGLCNGTGGIGPGAYIPSLNCDVLNAGNNTSRPVPCEDCNRTNNLTSACANSFIVKDEVTYRHNEGTFCPYEGGKWMVEKSWSGTVVVDPQGVSIPFVGKKGEESEQNYLADYFEGTGFYYKPPYDLSKKEDQQRAFREAGVFRKLAPQETQDQMKKAMVRRVIESKTNSFKMDKIRDYLVSYNNESARLSEFGANFPPEKKDDPNGTQREAWLKTKWGRLWPAVPMFTREDTPGEVIPYLGGFPQDQFEIKDEKATIEKVPHLARLYEVSRAINQILLPAVQNSAGNSEVIKSPIIASFLEDSRKVLLAQEGCKNCLVPNIVNPYVSGGLLRFTLSVCPTCSGYGTVGDVYMGACGNPDQVHSVRPSCFSSDNEAISSPIRISCPGTATICAAIRANRDVDESCQGQTISTSCTVNVDAQCNVVSSNCGVAPPPAPRCDLGNPYPVDKCEKTPLSGPGDTLCCSPIEVNLQATDLFENTQYEKCEYDPITGILLNPSCHDVEITEVNRQIGVALSHPYLKEIWNYTANNIKGFFNIFRPDKIPKFSPDEASGRVKYNYSSNSGKASFEPAEGDFFFPFLGGVQKAKEQVIQTLLPANSPGSNPQQNIVSSDKLGYSINITDTNQIISQATKQKVIAAVKNSWPDSKIDVVRPDGKINFDYVVEKARANGWNPALALAVWVEESGASGTNAYDFGCEAGTANDFESQLNCFVNLPYKPSGFEEFMCMFAEGEHHVCQFDTAVNFPKNLKYWYEELTS